MIKDKEKRRQYYKQYWEKIKDDYNSKRRQERANNPEAVREKERAAYPNRDRKKMAEAAARYRERDVENFKKLARLRMQKYRAIKKAAGIKIVEKPRKRPWSESKRLYVRHRRAHDLKFKITGALRHRAKEAIKAAGSGRRRGKLALLGCTVDEFLRYFEPLFKPGMTWDNHGTNGWHIDHIIPCAAFDLTNEEDQKRCFHYTNLQPLWADENRRKSDKVI